MIISISGQAGSGKSTTAKLLSKKLKFKHYSMGDLRRKMARERGLTISELNKLGEKEDFTDKEVDEYQKELGKKEDNFIVDGRLTFYFIPHSFKIFLDADIKERARRIFKDERKEEKFKNIADAKKELVEREKSDKKRYKKYYNINCYDKKHYDLVIDTTNLKPKEVIDKILKVIKK